MRKIKSYVAPHHYTNDELESAVISDLRNDAIQSERQAIEGPFFPENGVTAEMCIRYAAYCRAKITALSNA